ncbi:amidohydrolase [Lutimonas halocynthiae]|uniref:amidohydrolase n=1 Tax=Lutimonas halocynthiae TaxID=1446477 RepID=UPI0025B4B347|nr:amidohydrolase [Lutimonas halocynthiae]MDN3643091.1 amidohydrolase [Lutimonas halocynthiae]
MKNKLTLFLLALTLVHACTKAPKETADTIYTNGKIYTVNEAQPWAEAIAIKDGKIISVGTDDEIDGNIGKNTKVIDLGGKFVMPGLHDPHVHIEQAYKGEILGGQLLTFSANASSIKELQQLLKEYADKNPNLKVLFAQGLPQDMFPNSSPTKAFIDEVIPNRPVVILSDTEHEGLLNSKALEMEGIDANTPTPEGGTIDKDSNGEPTGYFREMAAGIWAWKHYPQLSPEKHKQGLQATIAFLNSIGVTSVKQQHAKNPIAIAAQDLEKEGNLNARIALSWTWKGPLEPMPIEEQEKMINERGRFSSDMIKTEFVKLSLDGNVGTTGYVLEPYLGTDSRGLPVFPNDDDLFTEVEKFDLMGLGISAHATGDAANRQLIDAIDRVKMKHGKVNARHQLAHASLIDPDDYKRLKDLDITAEFSPVVWFQTAYTKAVTPLLGPERMSRWYPMKSVIDNGGRITMGSDGPLMWQDTFTRLQGAVTRKDPSKDEEALALNEAIDLPSAIKAMTLNSAYIMNMEDMVGSLEIGKYADIIILDQNLFEIPVEEISATKVLKTILAGKEVFDSSHDPNEEDGIEEKYGLELDFSGEQGHPGCD